QAAAPAVPAAEPRAAPVVLSVEEELVGKVIGRGGEVVKELQKNSGARIDISKTGDSPGGKRSVFISGAQACVDKAKQLIEDILKQAREISGSGTSSNACVMKVSQELVGILIGKNGETIKDLKKESGARIDISKDACAEDPDARVIHITGPPECIEFAKKMVEEMIGKEAKKLGLPALTAGADADKGKADGDGDKTESRPAVPQQSSITIMNDLVGMLIGKGGDTINSISKDCGVRIEISKDDTPDKPDKRTVYLSGMPDNIERAKRMIKDTLSRSRENMGSRGRPASWSRSRSRSDPRRARSRSGDRDRSRGRNDSPGRKVLRVGQEFVGMLIGKGGETIKNISRDSGARIEVSKDDKDTDRSVTLSGSEESIKKASDMIDEVIGRARERHESRADKHAGRRARSRSRDDAPAERRSPVRDGLVSEKVYIDEVDMPFRPNFLPEHEDGLPGDCEVFVRNLPKACAERDLWEHLYRLGATDVKEILLLRRQKVSKGMAYVVFNRHDHAMLAKHKLHGAPAASVPCGGQLMADERGVMLARFSESERCINGRQCVYGTDMVGLLLGTRGKCMEEVKDASGLRKVQLTGRSMRSYGQVDDDPRLHMVVWYERSEQERVAKAVEVWAEQLSLLHKEIVEKAGKGKGMGK
ncbi:unnamed protein product, partial [Prorocentrum cordatum]